MPGDRCSGEAPGRRGGGEQISAAPHCFDGAAAGGCGVLTHPLNVSVKRMTSVLSGGTWRWPDDGLVAARQCVLARCRAATDEPPPCRAPRPCRLALFLRHPAVVAAVARNGSSRR